MVGIVKDSVVIRSFNEASIPVPNPLPKYGYITHDSTDFSYKGDKTLLPWYDEDFEFAASQIFASNISAAVKMVSTIFQYFNTNGVSHFFFDQRSTVGGGSPVSLAIALLSGGDRVLNYTNIPDMQSLEPNSVQQVYNTFGLIQQGEAEGVFTYPVLGLNTVRDCWPSAYLAAGVPSNGFFKGTPSDPHYIIWMNPCTTISATQVDLAIVKGTSVDQTAFDGNLGSDTCMMLYGSYTQPFSTGGGYYAFFDWYARKPIPRKGEEEIKLPLMFSLDRWESNGNTGYTLEDNTILASQSSNFDQVCKPHIVWDMNADVYFRDIGYVVGGSLFSPAWSSLTSYAAGDLVSYSGKNYKSLTGTGNLNQQPDISALYWRIQNEGSPWATQRVGLIDPVNYIDPFTWRDTAMERAFVMAADPNVKDHYYALDNYGFLSAVPVCPP
jgi:hypothetical protein